MGKYNEELGKAGVLLALDGLTPPATMSTRVTFKDGKAKVPDGPFPETKEVVGGFWIIQVKSREEALEWASRIPAKDNEMVVEVRRLFDLTDCDPETQNEIRKKFGDDVANEMKQEKTSPRFVEFRPGRSSMARRQGNRPAPGLFQEKERSCPSIWSLFTTPTVTTGASRVKR